MHCRRQQTQAKQQYHKKEWQLQRLGVVARFFFFFFSILHASKRMKSETWLWNFDHYALQAPEDPSKAALPQEGVAAAEARCCSPIFFRSCMLAKEWRVRLADEILIMHCRRQQTQTKQQYHKEEWQLQRLGAVARVFFRACVLAKEWRVRLDCEILIIDCRHQKTQAKQRNHKKE